MSNVTVGFEPPTSPDLTALHDARIAFSFEGYDPEDCFTPPIAALGNSDMRFRVARVDGTLAGMGALRVDDGWGEIKAIFTDPAMRGKGVARALMDELETVARAEGLGVVRLETGNLHKDALQFYPRLGWQEIPRFDPYPENDTSIFFEKVL
jgi:putative acetyltransferase